MERTGVVSHNFFEAFGITPVAGRTFRAADDEPGADAVLMLSNGYWQSRFGGDPTVVGQVFEMNDRPHTVIGVLPPIPEYPQANDVYMPVSACPFRSAQSTIDNRNARLSQVFGRARAGVPLEQVRTDVALVALRLQQAAQMLMADDKPAANVFAAGEIMAGNVLGKGTPAHAAAVVGDTVGDPFKDTAGPSLHVLVKLLATITLVLAPLFIR